MSKQKGQRNANARLNDEMVAHIKRCLLDKVCTQVALANRYNVTRHTISLIWRKRVWQEIEPSESVLGPRVRHIYTASEDEFHAIECGAKSFVIVYGYSRLYQTTDVLAILKLNEDDKPVAHLTRDVTCISEYNGIIKRGYCVLGLSRE